MLRQRFNSYLSGALLLLLIAPTQAASNDPFGVNQAHHLRTDKTTPTLTWPNTNPQLGNQAATPELRPQPPQYYDYSANLNSDVFGANLFTGSFARQGATQFNPNYAIAVGDVITGVIVPDSNYRERTTGLNYDLTVEAIGRAKEAAEGGKLMLEVNRIVKRAEVVVEVDDGSGQVKEVPALAGENLRKLLQRKGFKLYDYDTRRFDMPFAKGDCAGEGLCGTCLVEIKSGEELLNPKDNAEMMITKGRPLKWRAACRTIIGADNQAGRLRVVTKPQSAFKDELNPGVKSLN